MPENRFDHLSGSVDTGQRSSFSNPVLDKNPSNRFTNPTAISAFGQPAQPAPDDFAFRVRPQEELSPILVAPKTAGDVWREIKASPASYVPYLNIVDTVDQYKIWSIASRLRDGETVTPEEQAKLDAHILDQSRGGTIWYNALNIAARSVAFMGEFATGGALLKSGGKKAILRGISKKTDDAIGEIAERAVEKQILQRTVLDSAKLRAGRKVEEAAVDLTTLRHAFNTQTRGAGDEALARFLVSKELGEEAVSGAGTKVATWLMGPETSVRAAVTGALAKKGEKKAADAASREAAGALAKAELAGARVAKGGEAYVLEAMDVAGDIATKKATAAAATKKVGGLTEELGKRVSAVRGAAGSQLLYTAATGPGRTVLQPQRVFEQVWARMSPTWALTEDERGRVQRILLDEGDGFGEALRKSFLDLTIENMSETASEQFALMRWAVGPENAVIPLKAAFLQRAFNKLVKKAPEANVPPNQAVEWAKRLLLGTDTKSGAIRKLGWDGYFPELGEEVVGEIARMAVGLEEKELPDVEEVAAMALGFLINPMAAATTFTDMRQEKLTQKIGHVIDYTDTVATERLKQLEDDHSNVLFIDSEENAKGMRTAIREATVAMQTAKKFGDLTPIEKVVRLASNATRLFPTGKGAINAAVSQELNARTQNAFELFAAEHREGEISDADIDAFMYETMRVYMAETQKDAEDLKRLEVVQGYRVARAGAGEALTQKRVDELKSLYPSLVLGAVVDMAGHQSVDNTIAIITQGEGGAWAEMSRQVAETDDPAAKDRLSKMLGLGPMRKTDRDRYLTDWARALQGKISTLTPGEKLRLTSAHFIEDTEENFARGGQPLSEAALRGEPYKKAEGGEPAKYLMTSAAQSSESGNDMWVSVFAAPHSILEDSVEGWIKQTGLHRRREVVEVMTKWATERDENGELVRPQTAAYLMPSGAATVRAEGIIEVLSKYIKTRYLGISVGGIGNDQSSRRADAHDQFIYARGETNGEMSSDAGEIEANALPYLYDLMRELGMIEKLSAITLDPRYTVRPDQPQGEWRPGMRIDGTGIPGTAPAPAARPAAPGARPPAVTVGQPPATYEDEDDALDDLTFDSPLQRQIPPVGPVVSAFQGYLGTTRGLRERVLELKTKGARTRMAPTMIGATYLQLRQKLYGEDSRSVEELLNAATAAMNEGATEDTLEEYVPGWEDFYAEYVRVLGSGMVSKKDVMDDIMPLINEFSRLEAGLLSADAKKAAQEFNDFLGGEQPTSAERVRMHELETELDTALAAAMQGDEGRAVAKAIREVGEAGEGPRTSSLRDLEDRFVGLEGSRLDTPKVLKIGAATPDRWQDYAVASARWSDRVAEAMEVGDFDAAQAASQQAQWTREAAQGALMELEGLSEAEATPIVESEIARVQRTPRRTASVITPPAPAEPGGEDAFARAYREAQERKHAAARAKLNKSSDLEHEQVVEEGADLEEVALAKEQASGMDPDDRAMRDMASVSIVTDRMNDYLGGRRDGQFVAFAIFGEHSPHRAMLTRLVNHGITDGMSTAQAEVRYQEWLQEPVDQTDPEMFSLKEALKAEAMGLPELRAMYGTYANQSKLEALVMDVRTKNEVQEVKLLTANEFGRFAEYQEAALAHIEGLSEQALKEFSFELAQVQKMYDDLRGQYARAIGVPKEELPRKIFDPVIREHQRARFAQFLARYFGGTEVPWALFATASPVIEHEQYGATRHIDWMRDRLFKHVFTTHKSTFPSQKTYKFIATKATRQGFSGVNTAAMKKFLSDIVTDVMSVSPREGVPSDLSAVALMFGGSDNLSRQYKAPEGKMKVALVASALVSNRVRAFLEIDEVRRLTDGPSALSDLFVAIAGVRTDTVNNTNAENLGASTDDRVWVRDRLFSEGVLMMSPFGDKSAVYGFRFRKAGAANAQDDRLFKILYKQAKAYYDSLDPANADDKAVLDSLVEWSELEEQLKMAPTGSTAKPGPERAQFSIMSLALDHWIDGNFQQYVKTEKIRNADGTRTEKRMLEKNYPKRRSQNPSGGPTLYKDVNILVIDTPASISDGGAQISDRFSKEFAAMMGSLYWTDPDYAGGVIKAVFRDTFAETDADGNPDYTKIWSRLQKEAGIRTPRVAKAEFEGSDVPGVSPEMFVPPAVVTLAEIFKANPKVDVITFGGDNIKVVSAAEKAKWVQRFFDGDGRPTADTNYQLDEATEIVRVPGSSVFSLQDLNHSSAGAARARDGEKEAKQARSDIDVTMAIAGSLAAQYQLRYLMESAAAKFDRGFPPQGVANEFVPDRVRREMEFLINKVGRSSRYAADLLPRIQSREEDGSGLSPYSMLHHSTISTMMQVELKKVLQPDVIRVPLVKAPSFGGFGTRPMERIGDNVALPWAASSMDDMRQAVFRTIPEGVELEDYLVDYMLENRRWVNFGDLISFEALNAFLNHEMYIHPDGTGEILETEEEMLRAGLRLHEVITGEKLAAQLEARHPGADVAAINKPGIIVIPGEVFLEDRVPGDGFQSHVPMRNFLSLDAGVNLSISDETVQLNKGEDFDGDKGFATRLQRDKDGNLDWDSAEARAYNLYVLASVAVLTTAAYDHYKSNVDTAIAPFKDAAAIVESELAPPAAGAARAAAIPQRMAYAMPATENIYGEDTTTLALAKDGRRTATTRSNKLGGGKVGAIVRFEDDPQLYEVTGFEQLTEANVNDPAWQEQWSQKEGWTVEHFQKVLGGKTVHVGSWQTTFRRVDAAPGPSQAIPRINTPEYHDWVDRNNRVWGQVLGPMAKFNGAIPFMAHIGTVFKSPAPATIPAELAEAGTPARIISGGQTGADTWGIEVAQELGIPTGGTGTETLRGDKGARAPKTVEAITAAQVAEYREFVGEERWNKLSKGSRFYVPRTWHNVKNSDYTVWFGSTESAGFKATRRDAEELGKPFFVWGQDPVPIAAGKTINVAGNRESSAPPGMRAQLEEFREALRNPPAGGAAPGERGTRDLDLPGLGQMRLRLAQGDLAKGADETEAEWFDRVVRFKIKVGTGGVNAAVDDFKDPVLATLGLNQNTVGLFQILMLGNFAGITEVRPAGPNGEDMSQVYFTELMTKVARFLRSPMVEEFSELMGKRKSFQTTETMPTTNMKEMKFKNPNATSVFGKLNAKYPFWEVQQLLDLYNLSNDALAVGTTADAMLGELSTGTVAETNRVLQNLRDVQNDQLDTLSVPLLQGFVANNDPRAGSIKAVGQGLDATVRHSLLNTLMAREIFTPGWAEGARPLNAAEEGLADFIAGRAMRVAILSGQKPGFELPLGATDLKSWLDQLKAANPGNPFVEALAVERYRYRAPDQLILNKRLRGTPEMNPDERITLKRAFEALPVDTQFELALYAAIWWGNHDSHTTGNFNGLLGNTVLQHVAMLEPTYRLMWHGQTTRKRDEVFPYILTVSGEAQESLTVPDQLGREGDLIEFADAEGALHRITSVTVEQDADGKTTGFAHTFEVVPAEFLVGQQGETLHPFFEDLTQLVPAVKSKARAAMLTMAADQPHWKATRKTLTEREQLVARLKGQEVESPVVATTGAPVAPSARPAARVELSIEGAREQLADLAERYTDALARAQRMEEIGRRAQAGVHVSTAQRISQDLAEPLLNQFPDLRAEFAAAFSEQPIEFGTPELRQDLIEQFRGPAAPAPAAAPAVVPAPPVTPVTTGVEPGAQFTTAGQSIELASEAAVISGQWSAGPGFSYNGQRFRSIENAWHAWKSGVYVAGFEENERGRGPTARQARERADAMKIREDAFIPNARHDRLVAIISARLREDAAFRDKVVTSPNPTATSQDMWGAPYLAALAEARTALLAPASNEPPVNWRTVTEYRGLPVLHRTFVGADGEKIGARYFRKAHEEQGIEAATLTVGSVPTRADPTGPPGIAAAYDRYRRGDFRIHNVRPVGTFNNIDEFAAFVLEHEYQHHAQPRRVTDETRQDYETTEAYEDRINDAASRSLGRGSTLGQSADPRTSSLRTFDSFAIGLERAALTLPKQQAVYDALRALDLDPVVGEYDDRDIREAASLGDRLVRMRSDVPVTAEFAKAAALPLTQVLSAGPAAIAIEERVAATRPWQQHLAAVRRGRGRRELGTAYEEKVLIRYTKELVEREVYNLLLNDVPLTERVLPASTVRDVVRNALVELVTDVRDATSHVKAPGTAQVDINQQISSDPFVSEIVEKLAPMSELSLSGSVALAAFGTVYRPKDERPHDFDYRVVDVFENPQDPRIEPALDSIMEQMREKFPERVIIWNRFQTDTDDVVTLGLLPETHRFVQTASDTVTVVNVETGLQEALRPMSLDLFFTTDRDAPTAEVQTSVTKPVRLFSGKTIDVPLTHPAVTFAAKLRMTRLKDLNDFTLFKRTSSLATATSIKQAATLVIGQIAGVRTGRRATADELARVKAIRRSWKDQLDQINAAEYEEQAMTALNQLPSITPAIHRPNEAQLRAMQNALARDERYEKLMTDDLLVAGLTEEERLLAAYEDDYIRAGRDTAPLPALDEDAGEVSQEEIDQRYEQGTMDLFGDGQGWRPGTLGAIDRTSSLQTPIFPADFMNPGTGWMGEQAYFMAVANARNLASSSVQRAQDLKGTYHQILGLLTSTDGRIVAMKNDILLTTQLKEGEKPAKRHLSDIRLTQEDKDEIRYFLAAVTMALQYAKKNGTWDGYRDFKMPLGREDWKFVHGLQRGQTHTFIPKEDYVTIGKLEDRWMASGARQKLQDGNRPARVLEVTSLADTMRREFDRAHADLQKLEAAVGPFSIGLPAYKENYFPQRSGHGFQTEAEHARFTEERETLKEMGERMFAEPTAAVQHLKLTQAQLDLMLKQPPGAGNKPPAEVKARYIRVAAEINRRAEKKAKQKSQVVTGLVPKWDNSWDDLNARGRLRTIMQQAYYGDVQRQIWIETHPDVTPDKWPEMILTPEDAGVLGYLNKQLDPFHNRSNKFNEYAASLTETVAETWEELAQQGKKPGVWSPFDGLVKYSQETYRAASQRFIFTAGIVSKAADGRPLVFVVPAHADFDGAARLHSRDALYQMGRNMAEYLGTEFKPQPQDPVAEFLRLETLMKRKTDWTKEYVEMGSASENKFLSIERVYAAQGDGWNGWGPNARFALSKILQDPRKIMWPGTERDMMQDIMTVVQFTKFSTLSFSVFFANSALESAVGTNGLGGMLTFARHPIRSVKRWLNMRKMLLSNSLPPKYEEHLRQLRAHGYGFDISHDPSVVNIGVAHTAHDWLKNKEEKGPLGFRTAAKTGRLLIGGQLRFTKWMFNDWFPVWKTTAGFRLLDELAVRKPGGKLDAEDYSVVARSLNDSFGGQSWDQYWWATPQNMQALNLAMFAPNWTLSAFNVAGGNVLMSKMGMAPGVGQWQRDFMLKRYWPAMFTTVLVGWPNLLQGLIFAGFGDDEEDDVPFTYLNEPGKRLHVDITPLVRHLPWYKGGEGGGRRMYIRWGKQVYEVYGTQNSWMADAVNLELNRAFERKASAPVRLALELATGHVAGNAEWDLPFKGEGLMGLIWTQEKGVLGSRMAHIFKTAVPYSAGALVQPGGIEKLPFSAVGSVSKGASARALTAEYVKILKTISSKKGWDGFKNNAQARAALMAYGPQLVDTAIANGYSPWPIIDGARRSVMGELYGEFLEAFEKGKEAKMERLAGEILRATGTYRGLLQSMKQKNRQHEKSPYLLTREQLQTIQEAFGEASRR